MVEAIITVKRSAFGFGGGAPPPGAGATISGGGSPRKRWDDSVAPCASPPFFFGGGLPRWPPPSFFFVVPFFSFWGVGSPPLLFFEGVGGEGLCLFSFFSFPSFPFSLSFFPSFFFLYFFKVSNFNCRLNCTICAFSNSSFAVENMISCWW